jgi:hypothetical protein
MERGAAAGGSSQTAKSWQTLGDERYTKTGMTEMRRLPAQIRGTQRIASALSVRCPPGHRIIGLMVTRSRTYRVHFTHKGIAHGYATLHGAAFAALDASVRKLQHPDRGEDAIVVIMDGDTRHVLGFVTRPWDGLQLTTSDRRLLAAVARHNATRVERGLPHVSRTDPPLGALRGEGAPRSSRQL